MRTRDPIQIRLSSLGKTLAYVIPTIHRIQMIEPLVRRETGPIALVLVPTKEVRETRIFRFSSVDRIASLACSTNLRSVSETSHLVRSHRLFTVGGWLESKSREETVRHETSSMALMPMFDRLRRGLNILISTPGRICDHIDNTQSLSFKNIQFLIFDEADK